MIAARIVDPCPELAERHLEESQRVLRNVAKVPSECHTCDLAAFGQPTSKAKSQLQVLLGMLCTQDGIPVAVEVFPGNTGDSDIVGPALDWITALRAPTIRKLMKEGRPLQLSLFDEASIEVEAALDGIYVIRPNVSEDELGAEEVVRAHAFLCTLARYVRWHIERALGPLAPGRLALRPGRLSRK